MWAHAGLRWRRGPVRKQCDVLLLQVSQLSAYVLRAGICPYRHL